MRARNRRPRTTSAPSRRRNITPAVAAELLEDRTLLAAPHPFNLTGLNGANGFRVPGQALNDLSGYSVASAGDVNGDGFDDFIIGNSQADTTPTAQPNSREGSSYIVFGIGNATPAVINPASLNGANGFRLDGISANDRTGYSVQSAGDINNDGFDDLIVGAHQEPTNARNGAAFVVLGRNTFPAGLNLSGLSGNDGFRLDGFEIGEETAISVNSAGDVNNDGLADLIIGAAAADPSLTSNEPNAGRAYVVFGRTGGFASTINLGTLNGNNGFRIEGSTGYDFAGWSVASAGDFNGDGRDDIIIGAPQFTPATFDPPGAAYLVYGSTSAFPPIVNLSSLTGPTGFRLAGVGTDDETGYSVSGIGDFNGDGFDDVLIGAPENDLVGSDPPGRAYVVFGTSAQFPANFPLSGLNGSTGFVITGLSIDDDFGVSVSAAGDFNGDGFDDIIVGARLGDRAETSVSTGEAYVLFGRPNGFGGSLPASALDGNIGFRLNGIASGDQAGFSVGGGGDFNGDGFGDVIIGAPFRDQPGQFDAGESYIYFGGDVTGSVTHPGTSGDNEIFGDASANVMVGGRGNDVLHGFGGNDVLIGGAGDDILRVQDLTFDRVVGGNGFDTLKFFDTEGSFNIDLTTIPDNRITGIEQIDITSLPNAIKLTQQEVLNISDHSNELRLIINSVSVVDIGPIGGNGWIRQTDEIIDGATYTVYTQGNATLKVTILNEPPSDIILDNNSLPENLDSTNRVLVGNLTAVDIDTLDVHTFALVPGDGDTDNGFFEIINTQLYFRAGTNLDFETQNRFEIRIQTDDGEDTLDEVFEVFLTDVNDPPSDIVLFNTSLAEDVSTTVQALVGNFIVLDQDFGDTSFVSLVAGPGDADNPLFQITQDRLELRPRVPIDFETKSSYTIRLQADDGDATFQKSVVIQILDVNEAPTTLTLSQTSVEENVDTTLPFPVGSFAAADQDAGAVLTFSLASGIGDDDNAIFQVVGNELQIRAGVAVDHELQDSYSIRARVSDGENTLDQVFAITVSDLNEGPPTGIVLPDNAIDENTDTTNPADVGVLLAIDNDGPDTHTFSLVPGTGDDDNALFTISGNVLQVQPGVQLDFESRATYAVRVRVDDPDFFHEQSLTVVVNDVNETPTAIQLSNDTVTENTSTATNVLVGGLLAVDPDAVQNHAFSLVPGPGGNDNALFTIAGTNLFVRAGTPLDHESRDAYSIRVRVQDGPNQFEQTLTVAVADLNEGPVSNLQLSNNSVPENSDTLAGLLVGQLTATDIDGADTHTFTLVAGAGDTDNAKFQIINGSLQFQPGVVLDHEAQSIYSVRVRVTDGPSFVARSFMVQVTDENDTPHDVTLVPSQIPEDVETTSDVLVGTLTASDQDAADTHTFALVEGAGDDDNALFQIVDHELQLRAGAALDFENKPTLNIRVETSDGAATFQKMLSLQVVDRNDAPTTISLAPDSIDENSNTSLDVTIGTLTATDQDAGDSHVFRLIEGAGSSDNARFAIDGNQLVLKPGTLLDHEQQHEFSILVEAEDAAGALFSQPLIVRVLDLNEGSPTDIVVANAGAVENSDTTGPVLAGLLTAIDVDSKEQHQFELVPGEGSTDNGKFQITGNRLEFRPNTVLDFEAQSTFSVRVRATDQALTSFERSLSVSIVNINEGPQIIGPFGTVLQNPPVFSWLPVPNADHYDLWVNNITTGQSAVIRTDVVSTLFVPTSPLNDTHTYIWTVRAVNAAGIAGEFTAHRTFTVNPALPAPIPSTPGGSVSTLRPTFSWSAVPGAAGYEFVMNNLSTGQNAVIAATSLTGTSFIPQTPLVNGNDYQWTVRAVTATGAPGQYAPTQLFKVSEPPMSPVTIGPFGFVEILRPTLSWSAVPGAVRYDLWVNDTSTGESGVIRHTNLTTTSFTPTADLVDLHSYIWTVRAFDSQNRPSEFATHKTFHIEMPVPLPPATPALTGPGNVVNSTRPTFTWTTVSGAVRYDLWVNDRTTGQSAVIRNVSVQSGTFTPTVPLQNGHEYIWTVRAIDAIGLESPFAAHRIFRVEAEAPAAPVLLQPGAGAGARPSFSWQTVPGAVEYDLWVNDQTAGISGVIRERHLTANSFVPNFDLVAGHNYIWTVRAINAEGAAGTFAAHRTFLAAPALEAPALSGPIGIVNSTHPTFSWSAVAGANRYDLWVNDLTTGQSAVIRNTRVFGTQFTPTVALVADHSYVWTVRAIRSSGETSAWATHEVFTIRVSQLEEAPALEIEPPASSVLPEPEPPAEVDLIMAGWNGINWWENQA